MNPNHWQPTAELSALKTRASLLRDVRAFFDEAGVMEVDTQCLSKAAVSDPFIDTLDVQYQIHPAGNQETHYLQSSPEYAMKRLLAAGSGSIYQLGKVFRNAEVGRLHNPEFTMLEWYRPQFTLNQLIDEVQNLVSRVLEDMQWRRFSYRELFQHYLNIDPHTATLQELQLRVRQNIDAPFDDTRRDTWLELLMSELIEPHLLEPTIVYDFPASQAALSELGVDHLGHEVARRFELYIGGMELANGYQELRDANEQHKRLLADEETRKSLNLPIRPLELRLVAALESGLPLCAGVALGFDRLMMIKMGASHIQEVIPFAFDRA